MRKWYSAEANQDMRFVLQQLQDAIDDLDTKLAYHVDNGGAPASEATKKAYEEGKAIAGPLLAATEFALTFEKGRVKVWREQNEALRARCERLMAVVDMGSRLLGDISDTDKPRCANARYREAVAAMQPGDLAPFETKPA